MSARRGSHATLPAMLRQNRRAHSRATNGLDTVFQTAFYVFVCTGVSLIASGCQSPPAEPAGPERVVVEEAGLAFADLPNGCAEAPDPGERLFEIECVLPETTETPAGPAGRLWLELGEPTVFGLELDEIARSHRPFFIDMEGGEFFGGRQIVGPLGEARYTRGRYQAEDGASRQQIRVFMEHPVENRLVSLVYEHPAGEDGDTRGRINQLLVLVGEMELVDQAATTAEPETER